MSQFFVRNYNSISLLFPCHLLFIILGLFSTCAVPCDKSLVLGEPEIYILLDLHFFLKGLLI